MAAEMTGSVPIPDPTKLTTDAVNAATGQYRRELAAVRELLETRLSAMDKAAELLAETVNRWPTATDKAIASLRAEFAAADLALRELLGTRISGVSESVELAARERADQIHAVRELLEARINGMDKANELLAENVAQIASQIEKATAGLKEIFETRFAGMDEATKLLATNVDKVPYAILQEAGNLKAFIMSRIDEVQHVADEKFAAIDGTFASNALALTAALAAQKEAAAEQNKSNTLAITKSEQATKETIAANAAQTSSGQSALSRELGDLKERLVRLESGGVATAAAGSRQQQTDTFTQTDRIAATTQAAAREAATRAAIISVVAVLVAIAAILFAAIHG